MTTANGVRRFRGSALVIAVAMVSLGLGGCGTSVTPSKVARVMVTPGALLFTGAGATATLVAKAFDADGAPLDATIQWSSSDPSVVQVDPDGTVTTHDALGSALVTATAGGIDSFPASIVVAQPVSGAVLLTDQQVVEPPAPVDGTSNPIRQRAVLTGPSNLEPGTIILGAEAVAIGGKVVSVTPGPDGLVVVYAPLPPQELFDHLSIDEDIDLAPAAIEPADWLSGRARVRSDGRGTTTLNATGRVSTTAVTPTCQGQATYVSISGLSTSIENDLHYHLHLQDGVADPEPTKLYVDGNITQKVSGGLSVQAGFSGTYTCTVVLFHVPIPIGGVAALVASPDVPVGLAASASGSVTGAGATVSLESSAGFDLKVGFIDDPVKGFKLLHDVKPKYQAPSLKTDLVTPPHFRVGVSGFVGLASGVDLRVAGIEDISLVQAQLGPKQSFDLAGAEAQADSGAYASSYDLSIVASAGIGVDLGKLLKWLGIGVSVQAQQFQATYPIAKSPSGTFKVSETDALPGDQVHLHVALDTNHLSYLGHYNVSKIEIYLATGTEEPSLYRTIPLSASNQADFDTVWDTTGLAEGEYRFYAFVVDDLLAKVVEVPLELSADSKQVVRIAGVCTATEPGAVSTMSACTGGTSWDYSQTDDANGIAWEVHTTGSDLTFQQDPEDPNSFLMTAATVSWTDEAHFMSGCDITSSGSNLRVTNTDPDKGTYLSGRVTIYPNGMYAGNGYVYVPDGADNGCLGGTWDESVPLVMTSGDGPTPIVQSDGQGGSLLTGTNTTTTDVDGVRVVSWTFHFPDVPPP